MSVHPRYHSGTRTITLQTVANRTVPSSAFDHYLSLLTMTFCSTATRLALRRLSAEHRVAVSLPGKRNFGYAASAVGGWYSLFGRSTGMYAAWIAVGIVGAEVVTGKITDTTWNTLNHGRTFETYDWSKFDQFEEDEDDDDEEEEEEEEEGDGDDDEDEDDDE